MKHDPRRTDALVGRLVAAGLLLALLAGCRSPASGDAAAGGATPTPLPTPIVPEKPAYTVQRGTVVETLEFTGRATPTQEQELFFESPGTVGQVAVARGDWVKAGDLLAALDVDDLEKQLAQKKIALETARLRLDEAQIQAAEAITSTQTKLETARQTLADARASAANDLAAARASVASAETSLANAQLNQSIVQTSDVVSKNVRERENEANWYEVYYGECLAKFQAGQIDQDRLTLEYNNLLTARDRLAEARAQAELALSQAQAQVSQAEESLRQARFKLAEAEGLPAVAAAQTALDQAELDAAQAVADADPGSLNLRLLALEMEQSNLDIQDLEDQIASARLMAPFDGQILSLSLEEGDTVAAYSAVGALADPGRLEITADLGSEELSQMALDQAAEIILRNRPSESFPGTVRQLPYPYGGTTVDTGDDTAVHVTLDDARDVSVGELATVRITLQEKDGVLWLPPAAIRTYQGRDFVVVQNRDGTQQRLDVLLGIATDERVEIIAGLEEGQIVVGE